MDQIVFTTAGATPEAGARLAGFDVAGKPIDEPMPWPPPDDPAQWISEHGYDLDRGLTIVAAGFVETCEVTIGFGP